MVETISITDGYPTVFPILVLTFFYNMVLDGYQEYARAQRDKEENKEKVMKYFRQIEKYDGTETHTL